MGNQVTCGSRAAKKSHSSKSLKTSKTFNSGGVAQATKTISCSPSATQMKNNSSHAQFVPLDILTKTLFEMAQCDESAQGITENTFIRYLFPYQTDLGERLFIHLHTMSKVTTNYIPSSVFKHQTEMFISVMNDQTILENYVKMYTDEENNLVTPRSLRSLLMVSYKLAMSNNGSHTCLHLRRTIEAVLTSCFHGKESLSVNFVVNWLNTNCPLIVRGLHRYVVHILTTAYRNGKSLMSIEQSQLDPGTPILEQPNFLDQAQCLLPMSHVWLLSTVLPEAYTKGEEVRSENGMHALIMKMSGDICPSHWTLLYDSDQHGLGANRFTHHVMGYRGPTLLFIKGNSPDEKENFPIYCVCSSLEWKESHVYWGDEESMVISLLPSYKVIERGAKLLYLNMSIRGYPQGLRAGNDPRNPCVDIDQAFQSITLAGVPYRLSSLQVWGCGDTKSREQQIEIKNWQVKEVEKQRMVKLTASDWLDHPDRYLLQLAGRPTYNNSGS